MDNNRKTVTLNESEMVKFVIEVATRLVKEIEDFDYGYIDSLGLNTNKPNDGWFKDSVGLYKIGPDGKKYYDRFGDLKYMPYVDDRGKRHMAHVATWDRFDDPSNDDEYTKNLHMRNMHGNANFLDPHTNSYYPPSERYINTGEAGHYNPKLGYAEKDGDAEADLRQFNQDNERRINRNYNNALAAADRRPLHRKGSVNRELMGDEQGLQEAIRRILRDQLGK